MDKPQDRALRVVLVEDSPTASAALCALLRETGFEVAGTAAGVAEAEQLVLAARPQLVLSDVRLTDGTGLDLTRRLLAGLGVPIVLITAHDPGNPELIFDAMAAGALEVLAKPPARGDPAFADYRRRFEATLRTLAGVPVIRRRAPLAVAPAGGALPELGGQGDAVIALGASTGGPVLVGDALAALKGRQFACALVAQHIVPDFCESFARWLAQHSGLEVRVARDGELPAGRTAYLAPGGHHLQLGPDGRLRLAPAGRAGAVPSVDVLFESLALAHGRRSLAILLTGMGRDGAAGLAKLRQAGAHTVAQAPATAPVDSMPRAAIALGAAIQVLGPQEIIALLGRLPAVSR